MPPSPHRGIDRYTLLVEAAPKPRKPDGAKNSYLSLLGLPLPGANPLFSIGRASRCPLLLVRAARNRACLRQKGSLLTVSARGVLVDIKPKKNSTGSNDNLM